MIFLAGLSARWSSRERDRKGWKAEAVGLGRSCQEKEQGELAGQRWGHQGPGSTAMGAGPAQEGRRLPWMGASGATRRSPEGAVPGRGLGGGNESEGRGPGGPRMVRGNAPSVRASFYPWRPTALGRQSLGFLVRC